jgi:hypothetical protein
MKHILLIILFITSFTLTSSAQLDKGTWLTGGSASFYSFNQEFNTQLLERSGKFTEVNLSASGGYFIIDKLSLGAKSSFRYYKGTLSGLNGEITSPFIILLGPNVRYYFLKHDKPFNFLTEFNYQFGIYQDITSDTNGKPNNNKGKGNSLSALAGTEVFFNETAGLELLFGYKKNYLEERYADGNFTIDKRSGLYLTIGFNLHLKNY